MLGDFVLLEDRVFVAPLRVIQGSRPYSRMMRIILYLIKMIKLIKLIKIINIIKIIKLIKIIKMIDHDHLYSNKDEL